MLLVEHGPAPLWPWPAANVAAVAAALPSTCGCDFCSGQPVGQGDEDGARTAAYVAAEFAADAADAAASAPAAACCCFGC